MGALRSARSVAGGLHYRPDKMFALAKKKKKIIKKQNQKQF